MAHFSVSLKSDEAIPKEARIRLTAAAEAIADEYNTIEVEEEAVEPSFKVVIEQDQFPMNPRTDSDHAGVMFCKHERYTLGDKDAQDPYEEDEETGKRRLRDGIVVCLPLGLYDHSGITIFHGTRSAWDSAGWDSGQVGWHYMTKATLLSDFNGDLEAAERCMKAELEEYDQYLRGNVWFVSIANEEDRHIDSCSGFIGGNIEQCGILDHFDEKYRAALRAAWEDRFA